MIHLTDVAMPSDHVQARSRLMWATRYDIGAHTISFKVVPFGAKFDHKTKDRRLVLFDLRRGIAECLSLETGEVCNANSFGRLCSHVYRAHCVMDKGNRKREQKAA
jgi:hypothetical protein